MTSNKNSRLLISFTFVQMATDLPFPFLGVIYNNICYLISLQMGQATKLSNSKLHLDCKVP